MSSVARYWREQAKADAKALAKEEERLRKVVESRDSRLATLVAEKQRLTEDAEQRQREVRRSAARTRRSYVCVRMCCRSL